MSALLLHWLNEELQLHRKVFVIERDLSNGYIFAEILHVHGLEQHLDKYDDSSTIATKVQNLEHLGQTLEIIGLPLPIQQRRAIMMEDRPAVLQLLLQLKEFVHQQKQSKPSRDTKRSQKRAATQASIISHSAKTALTEKHLPCDIEERFVQETTQKFQPKEVCFEKNVNMSIHLRKFEQAQWNMENELQKIQMNDRAEKAADNAAQMTSLRSHLKDKQQFIQQWDKEHLEKWQQTQRLHMQVERNDLRLELTMEQWRHINNEAALANIQLDAAQGVSEFEKNMNRLGLTSSSVGDNKSLRAIPASDPGALTHFRMLETHVKQLNFRPSSNVKMMKELRERRKAQLAAEKDRRQRRRKASIDQNRLNEDNNISSHNEDTVDVGGEIDAPSDSMLFIGSDNASILNAREKYLEDKRADLEANYEFLREVGSKRRELDMHTLKDIRLRAATKADFYKMDICSDAVHALIDLALHIVSLRSISNDDIDMKALVQTIFLKVTPRREKYVGLSLEEEYELSQSVHDLMTFSGFWRSIPLQYEPEHYDACMDLQHLVDFVLSSSRPAVLNTEWEPPSTFNIACIVSKDVIDEDFASRVAAERKMMYIHIDTLLSECIKNSYDPQKQQDLVAAFNDRERELGAFGPKITAFRQKNAILPDSLIVDIVATAISLCRRQSYAQANDNEEEAKKQASLMGCILHNFPRTMEQAKLLEKTLLETIDDEELRTEKTTAFEVLFSKQEPNCTYVSMVNSIIVVSSIEDLVVNHTDGHEAQSTVQVVMPSDSQKVSTISSTDKIKRDDADAQARQLEELENAKRLEQHTLLEQFWSQCSRLLKINQARMHQDVFVETIHLWIDYCAQAYQQGTICVVDCNQSALPTQLLSARESRHALMTLPERVAWMRASNELMVSDDDFVLLVEELNVSLKDVATRLNNSLQAVRNVLCEVTSISQQTVRVLEAHLSGTTSFQLILDNAARHISSLHCELSTQNQAEYKQRKERALTDLEVSLGDLVDMHRTEANHFVEQLAMDLPSQVDVVINRLYELLPSICFTLKEHTLERLELLRTRLYENISFLSCSVDSLHEVRLPREIAMEAMDASMKLDVSTAADSVTRTEVARILGQVTEEYSFHLSDSKPTHPYALHEQNVRSVEIKRLLQRFTLTCRFADELKRQVRQLAIKDVKRLKEYILEDLQQKNIYISRVMDEVRSHGQAKWPTPPAFMTYLSPIGMALPRRHRDLFLSVDQLGALVIECRALELQYRMDLRGYLEQEHFIAVVLKTAKQKQFPESWQDSTAIANLALRLKSSRGIVSWRIFLFSLVCTEFLGSPSLEVLIQCCKHIHGVKCEEGMNRDMVLNWSEFQRLPMWFEQAVDSTGHANGHIEGLKTLLFQIFSSEKSENVKVLPMLICWCIYPSCPWEIRPELNAFLPSFSRGLLRVFKLLCQWKRRTSVSALEMDLLHILLNVVNVDMDDSRVAKCGGCDGWKDHEVNAFLQFCDTYDANLRHFFLFEDPFVTFVDSTYA